MIGPKATQLDLLRKLYCNGSQINIFIYIDAKSAVRCKYYILKFLVWQTLLFVFRLEDRRRHQFQFVIFRPSFGIKRASKSYKKQK